MIAQAHKNRPQTSVEHQRRIVDIKYQNDIKRQQKKKQNGLDSFKPVRHTIISD